MKTLRQIKALQLLRITGPNALKDWTDIARRPTPKCLDRVTRELRYELRFTDPKISSNTNPIKGLSSSEKDFC